MSNMNVLIENYRGFDIYFDPNNERFETQVTPGKWHEKRSFSSAKKDIDDYIKDNILFTPVQIISKSGNIITLTGIRKDGRFVYEKDGKKEQLSEYYEKDYKLYNPKEHDILIANMMSIEAEKDSLHEKKRLLENRFTGVTLSELKQQYKSLTS